MQKRSTTALLAVALGLTLACGSDSNAPIPGGGGGRGGGGGGGTSGFTATVDGTAWAATTTSQKATLGALGQIVIKGDNGSAGIELDLYNIDQVGTYAIGVGGGAVGGQGVYYTVAALSWSTPASGAAGTVTITTLTTSQIVGTFSFTAGPLGGGATGTKVVTSGVFNLLLGTTGATTWPLPDQYGTTIVGTIGGAAWNAAGGAIQFNTAGTTMSWVGNNTSYTLGVVTTNFTGVGTYGVADPTAGDATVTLIGPANSGCTGNTCWNSLLTGVGTFTVTSVTPTRIKGNLTVTMQPTAGSTATAPIDVNVNYDVGRP